jgi:hypothetical protein
MNVGPHGWKSPHTDHMPLQAKRVELGEKPEGNDASPGSQPKESDKKFTISSSFMGAGTGKGRER